jgi:hypothetical protein
MSDLKVTLDGFVFQGFEVPETMPFGGGQALSIKKLIGGKRVIDAMGADERAIEWSGRFRGPNAVSRARALDDKRKAGKAVQLTWGDFSYTVVIAAFHPVEERAYEVPYSITCEVVSESAGAAAGPGIDQMIQGDNLTAQALGLTVGDGPLSGVLGGLNTAISAVSGFASATQATIASVLGPIAQVQGRVTALIATAENMISGVVTLGGVLPNNPIASLTAGLNSQASAMIQAANLYDLRSTVGRMAANLSAVGAGGAQVVMAGGDLYHLASTSYNDATAWTTIAKANKLTDPIVQGVQTILVPPLPGSSGGVLSS